MARLLVCMCCAAVLPALAVEPTRAQDKAPAAPETAATGGDAKKLTNSATALLREVVNKEMEESVRAGLAALAELQDKEKGFFGNDNIRVATTALAGLALLASGSLPGSGPYGTTLQSCVDYLLSVQDPNTGYICDTGDQVSGGSRIHGHAYAMSFLSQVYGQGGKPERIRAALTQAVKLIEAGQTSSGGWGYVPTDTTWDEGSVTVCVLQGLRNAQNAGIAVKNETIAAAIGHFEKIAVPHTIKVDDALQDTYTFMYSLDRGGSYESYALIAAACASLNNLGVHSKSARWNEKDMGKILDGGMRWMMAYWKQVYGKDSPSDASAVRHYYYASFYAAQAAWQYSDTEYFRYFFPKVRDQLVAEQKRNGGQLWSDAHYGSAYASAMALLVLQVPSQYLPAFQR